MTFRGHFAYFLIALAAAASPLAAQETTQDQRIQQLEQKLDQLTKEAAEIRQELNAIKRGQPPAPAAAAEDLTKVEVATPAAAPAPAAAAETQAGSMTDVQTVNNAANPGASKVFNPDTSVIGNFLGKAGQSNRFERATRNNGVLTLGDERPSASLDEAEIAFEAFVDPYAKAKFFFSVTPDGIDVEEGYANFITLPNGLTAKVGKMKATFGKDNTWHAHVRPWVDQPLVIHNFFGDEGLADSGISVSKTLPNIANTYLEATGEIFNGKVADVFEKHNGNDLFYNGHLKGFRDISENSNIEIGTSYARGTLPEVRGTNEFAGLDVTYRWKPLQQGLYRSFIGRFEGITNRRADADKRLNGFYASADYQLAQRWFTGLRIDEANRFGAFSNGTLPVPALGQNIFTDRGVSATLTFWPSEFSQLRGQLRRLSYGGEKSVTELLLQLQFSIGAHGAHTF